MSLGEMRGMLEAGVDARTVWELSASYRENLNQSDAADLNSLWQAANNFGSGAQLPLEMFELAVSQRKDFESELETALSTPRSTARLLIWLPVIGLLSAQIVGLNPFAALNTTLGQLVFGFALLLTILGRKLSNRMLRKVSATPPRADLEPLLIAMRLKSGARLEKPQMPSEQMTKLMQLSVSTGAALSPLLISHFLMEQQRVYQEGINKARELGIKILIPLGLTSLPAFVMVSVIPILISSLGSIRVN